MGKYTQESYTLIVRKILSEEIFLQHMTKYMGFSFVLVEKVLYGILFPCLFFVKTTPLPLPIIEILIINTVKIVRFGLQNLVTSAHKQILSSQRAIIKLDNEVTGKIKFSTMEHIRAGREDHIKEVKARNKSNEIKLSESV